MSRLFICIVIFFTLLINIHSSDEIVSPLAGSWYPSNKEILQLQIDKYLNKAKPQKLGNVIALILPHAGYEFSAQTAALIGQ